MISPSWWLLRGVIWPPGQPDRRFGHDSVRTGGLRPSTIRAFVNNNYHRTHTQYRVIMVMVPMGAHSYHAPNVNSTTRDARTRRGYLIIITVLRNLQNTTGERFLAQNTVFNVVVVVVVVVMIAPSSPWRPVAGGFFGFFPQWPVFFFRECSVRRVRWLAPYVVVRVAIRISKNIFFVLFFYRCVEISICGDIKIMSMSVSGLFFSLFLVVFNKYCSVDVILRQNGLESNSS